MKSIKLNNWEYGLENALNGLSAKQAAALFASLPENTTIYHCGGGGEWWLEACLEVTDEEYEAIMKQQAWEKAVKKIEQEQQILEERKKQLEQQMEEERIRIFGETK